MTKSSSKGRDTKWDVVVIGGGAAGLMAAAQAAERGRRTLLVEKNRRAGVKILMSGGTRCNLTHALDDRGVAQAFGKQGNFLRSALASLGPEQVVDLFEDEGVRTKVEPTGKIFPASDDAADVLNALLRRFHRAGAKLALSEPVLSVRRPSEGFEIETDRRTIRTESVIVTVGGKSIPSCGTTGDGYAWLENFGHTITPTHPSLVPLTVRADWSKSLKGISVPDTDMYVAEPDKPNSDAKRRKKAGVIAAHRGAMLFTHFGLSGPSVLNVSRGVVLHERPRSLELVCDLMPDVPISDFEQRLGRFVASHGKKPIVSFVDSEFPKRLAEALVRQARIPVTQRAAELSKTQQACFVQSIKALRFPITGTMGFKKAEVTTGGVALGEVDSRTMESKLIPNLYIAGEILDVDGPIGGFNFQAAFSTGFLAGGNA